MQTPIPPHPDNFLFDWESRIQEIEDNETEILNVDEGVECSDDYDWFPDFE